MISYQDFNTTTRPENDFNPFWRFAAVNKMGYENIRKADKLDTIFTNLEEKKLLMDPVIQKVIIPFIKNPNDTSSETTKALHKVREILPESTNVDPTGETVTLGDRLEAGILAGKPLGALVAEDAGLSPLEQVIYERCCFDVRDLLDSPYLLAMSLMRLLKFKSERDPIRLTGMVIAYRLGFRTYERWRGGDVTVAVKNYIEKLDYFLATISIFNINFNDIMCIPEFRNSFVSNGSSTTEFLSIYGDELIWDITPLAKQGITDLLNGRSPCQ